MTFDATSSSPNCVSQGILRRIRTKNITVHQSSMRAFFQAAPPTKRVFQVTTFNLQINNQLST